jgi:magnesium-transporting ATPase (P-type)
MFAPSSIFSTVAQAAIHLVAMTVGVNYGRNMESGDTEKGRLMIRLSGSVPYPIKAGKLMSALAAQEWVGGIVEEEDGSGKEEQSTGLFRRQSFRANYETNTVFIFSILQGALSSVLNHEGKPFYRSILESKELCFFSLLNMLVFLALVLESFPFINNILELRTLPSLRSKLTFLSIAFANVLGCVACQFLSKLLFSEKISTKHIMNPKKRSAADEEVTLLREESKENLKIVVLAFGFAIYLFIDTIAKHKLSQVA